MLNATLVLQGLLVVPRWIFYYAIQLCWNIIYNR